MRNPVSYPMSDSKMIGPKIIQKMAKTSFTLTMFDDDETERYSSYMNEFELMFNHSKNIFPDEYYQMQQDLPIGSKVKVTFEVQERLSKTSFILTMFDDDETKEASLWMNDISVMFNHSKNVLPDEYYQMQDGFPLGSKVKVTFEILN